MADILGRLEVEARDQLLHAYAPKSTPVLDSALKALARFARCVPSRRLFRVGSKQSVQAHNEWTLVLFAQFWSTQPSAKTGRPLGWRTIKTYISLIKNFLSVTYGFTLVASAPRLKVFVAALAHKDPMGGVRKKRRGIRRHHLRRLWRAFPHLRCETPAALNAWAALTTAWHLLARGGELAAMTRADVTFGRSAGGKRWVRVMLRPLKKRGSTQQPKIPQFIAAHDGQGSDAYAALKRLCRGCPLPASRAASTPLFHLPDVNGNVKPLTSALFRAFVKRMASLLGLPPREFGAHSPRIGGATDLAATGSASQVLLQAKGRWASDVSRIYTRLTRRAQLAGSSLMQRAKGRDLEEIFPDFTQPA